MDKHISQEGWFSVGWLNFDFALDVAEVFKFGQKTAHIPMVSESTFFIT
jgi:hypothetical protein